MQLSHDLFHQIVRQLLSLQLQLFHRFDGPLSRRSSCPLPDEEEPSDTYPEAIERTKDLLGLQLYEAIHTLEDVKEEDAMYEYAL